MRNFLVYYVEKGKKYIDLTNDVEIKATGQEIVDFRLIKTNRSIEKLDSDGRKNKYPISIIITRENASSEEFNLEVKKMSEYVHRDDLNEGSLFPPLE